MSRYKAFPPGRGHLQVPVSRSDAALAGLSLYAPCRPRGLLLRDTAWFLVSRMGSWALPGKARPVLPPMEPDAWARFLEHWRSQVTPFDDVALYFRTQTQRTGFITMLLREGRPVAFLKVRASGDPELTREHLAVLSMAEFSPRSFHAPSLLGMTDFENRTTLAFAALDADRHRPPSSPPISEITLEIAEALASLPKPPGTPSHWSPSHGDLTPWNLRERSDGSLVLVDWENAGWAPPGADEILYRASACAVLGTPWNAVSEDHHEASGYWRRRLVSRTGQGRDARLAQETLRALASHP